MPLCPNHSFKRLLTKNSASGLTRHSPEPQTTPRNPPGQTPLERAKPRGQAVTETTLYPNPPFAKVQYQLKPSNGLTPCSALLFEYNYFGLERFKTERGLQLSHEHQVLAFSQAPADADYLGFLNSLRIRTLAAQAERITPLGDLTDFAELAG
jgi:hypothetical protein